MKWIIVAVVLTSSEPTRVTWPEKYDTIGECNYEMMRRVFQMRTTAKWSLRCVEVMQ
jgi:hypothetical protein